MRVVPVGACLGGKEAIGHGFPPGHDGVLCRPGHPIHGVGNVVTVPMKGHAGSHITVGQQHLHHFAELGLQGWTRKAAVSPRLRGLPGWQHYLFHTGSQFVVPDHSVGGGVSPTRLLTDVGSVTTTSAPP